MIRVVVTTAFCMVIVTFYSCFLVALCKDRKRRWIGYQVRLEPGANELQIVDLPRRNKSQVRAA